MATGRRAAIEQSQHTNTNTSLSMGSQWVSFPFSSTFILFAAVFSTQLSHSDQKYGNAISMIYRDDTSLDISELQRPTVSTSPTKIKQQKETILDTFLVRKESGDDTSSPGNVCT